MNDTISMIGGAMRAEADALRVVSQNIANSETVGYRRQVPIAHAQFDALVKDAADSLTPTLAQSQVGVDFKTATLKSTGEPLNLALDGPGFFVLDTEQGPLYTRRGDFHLAPDGTIVSSSGQALMGEKGAMQIGSGMPTISTDGVVSVNGNPIDQLRIVNIVDSSRIESLGDGTYRADTSVVQDGERPLVRQGYLESSNVVPVNEMVQLMEIVRRFETEQKFALAYNGMLDKAISEIGKI